MNFSTSRVLKPRSLLPAAACALLMSACGGGGGDATPVDPAPTPTPTPTPTTPTPPAGPTTAESCAALRSGEYLLLSASTTEGHQQQLTIDAKALTATPTLGAVQPWTAVPGQPCRFSTLGHDDVMVAASGAAVVRKTRFDGGYMPALLLPKQRPTVADLAGDWTVMSMVRVGSAPIRPIAVTFTIQPDGAINAWRNCDLQTRNCTAPSDTDLKLQRDADESLHLRSASSDGDVFGFRSESGEWMLATLGAGEFSIGTRQRANALPSVDVTTKSWNMTVSADMSASEPTLSTTRTTGADGSTGVYSRNLWLSDTVTRPERIRVNDWFQGLNHRLPETVTTSDGGSATVSEFFSLPLAGMGLSVVSMEPSGELLLSVVRP